MRASTIALSLAAAASASPAPPHYYGIAFSVSGNNSAPNYVSANLVLAEGTASTYLLKGERLSVYPGTPAFFVSNHDNTPYNSLTFIINGTIAAGASAPAVGDNYGYAAPVTASGKSSVGDRKWTISRTDPKDRSIILGHQQTAALQSFFACDTQLQGKPATVLSWGVYGSDGKPPKNCKITKVILNDNQGK